MHDIRKLRDEKLNFKKILEKSRTAYHRTKQQALPVILNELENKNNQRENIIYGINQTPFGKILLAKTDNGISDLLFITESEEYYIEKLRKKWQNADFSSNNKKTEKLVNRIFFATGEETPLKLHLIGTEFQLKVWQALLNIPQGRLVSYSDISKFTGQPAASRAVGTAIGKNPVHYLIPCHRVIKSDGALGGFAAGVSLKRKILERELCGVIC